MEVSRREPHAAAAPAQASHSFTAIQNQHKLLLGERQLIQPVTQGLKSAFLSNETKARANKTSIQKAKWRTKPLNKQLSDAVILTKLKRSPEERWLGRSEVTGTHTHTYIQAHADTYERAHTNIHCAYACVNARTHRRMHRWTRTHKYTHPYERTYACTRACLQALTHSCMCSHT